MTGEHQNDNQDVKLIYEQAQQSAEHHGTLLWEVTYIIWGSTTLLLGFVLEAIQHEPLLSLLTAFLSIFLSIMVLRFAWLYRRLRNTKYEICKQIEDTLTKKDEWKQHKATTGYSPGEQTWWYWTTTFVFIVVWLCVAIRSVMYLCHFRR